VLHGTGVNRSEERRFVATMSNVKSWMRTQENWVVSLAPDVLESASLKLLHRMGLQALTYGATIEGFGLAASGRVGEPWGAIKQFRSALDRGEYVRVRRSRLRRRPRTSTGPTRCTKPQSGLASPAAEVAQKRGPSGRGSH
jgi:hypothetical protein